MPNELIIGSNGYLGQYLAWSRRNADCVLHSRSPAGRICTKTGLPFIQEDILTSCSSLSQLDPEIVYLLARPNTQDANQLVEFAKNVQWLLQEWANRGCLKRVVFTSTQLVYATPKDDVPLTTSGVLGPESHYDCHKVEMEFYLTSLAHHQCGLQIEIFRLPLLAGRPPTVAQAKEQLLFQWRTAYHSGKCWSFPENSGHQLWGNSWVHVNDVVQLMSDPPMRTEPLTIVQPVSGNFRYVDLDRLFRAESSLMPTNGQIHLPQTSFYLEDNTKILQRDIKEAFTDELI